MGEVSGVGSVAYQGSLQIHLKMKTAVLGVYRNLIKMSTREYRDIYQYSTNVGSQRVTTAGCDTVG